MQDKENMYSRSGGISLIFILLFFSNANCQLEYNNKGALLLKEGKYYEAANYFEKVLEEGDSSTSLYLELSKCYLIVSPRSKSLKYILKAIELTNHPTLEMYYLLGRAYHVNNEFDLAIENYKESDPDKNNFKAIRKLTMECLNAKKYFSTPIKVEINNAGTIINTEQQEYLPYITADCKQLFFTSTKLDIGLTTSSEEFLQEDIYTSTFSKEEWTKPSIITALSEQNNHDACVGISEDGQTMFVYKGTRGGDIYTSTLNGTSWGEIRSLPFNSEGFEGAASLSPDGLTLYFVHSSGANTDRDIYFCTRNLGGKWSKAAPLSQLNTEYNEDSPFIHPNGKTLYFSSKGHSSMGGYDIFKSVMSKDGTWTAPENLGYPINSTADDLYFVLSANGMLGFYSSDKEGGYGKQDIYALTFPKSNDYSLELLTGEIKDENGNPIEADIMVTDNQNQVLIATFKSNSDNGKFLISLPCGKNYGIHIEKAGFIFHSENAQIECQFGFKEINKEIRLKSAHSGAKIILNNIFFDFGKYELKKESETELQKLIKLLETNKNIKIEISGYTDTIGDENANLILSELRAKNVMNYLISHEINDDRIVSKGYGSALPVSDNETDEGRQLNRRTEFKIL